ncbi:DUF4190 domain-containing protein [Streptomyces sp. NPDC006512]|uniref:DUF4190 domain-containing protein n=1 Tax=Streptomyces sp. NPDC006512 TaxID=3154307 RepID=UPI0033A40BB0
MSTPPNPPSSPAGPPTEPEGTPIPETPARPSLDKRPPAGPGPASPSLSKAPAPQDAAPADAAPSLSKTPAPADAVPAPVTPPPAAPAAPVTPAAPATPTLVTPSPSPSPAPVTPPPAAPAAPSAPADHNPFAAPAPGAPAPAGQFAPLTPAPAAPPVGGYGAPANAWGAPAGPVGGGPGYPGYPGYPGQTGYPPPAPRAANGLAVASLVLGLVALPVCFAPFFFWIGTLIGLTGLGIGIAAMAQARSGAPRKGMALAGTVLGGLSLLASVGGGFLTVAVLHEASDRVEQSIEEAQRDEPYAIPSYGLPPAVPSEGPGLSTPLAFGETFTYPNGIKVSLSSPKKYVTSSEYIEVGNAVQVTMTITNTTDKPHEVIYAVPDVTDEKGNEGKLVYDGRMPKDISGTVKPGETATGTIAYEVPAGTRNINAQVSPGILLPDAKFSGPIG